MYNRLYRFLLKKLIYSFQFGFRQKHSTTHALVHLTELIRKQLDNGNYDCGIFGDSQAFDTVNHDMRPKKLEHYGIRGVSTDFTNQFVSINEFNSALVDAVCGVPQGSILGPLLFIV